MQLHLQAPVIDQARDGCELLGFDEVSENSLDAVSDRDFIMNLPRMRVIMTICLSFSEELILWMDRLGFIDIADRFCRLFNNAPEKKSRCA